MTPAQVLIFDMDGLLFDTETLYVEATSRLVEPHGHTITPEIYGGWVGRDVSPQEYVETFPGPYTAEEFRQQLRTLFYALCDERLALLPGVLEFLDGPAAGYPKAIASSSRLSTITSHLDQLGLRARFDVLVSGRDVPRGKPAPDVFLAAAERLGVAPAACVVFEDSLHGITGAKAAGMRAVAVPTEWTAHLDFSAADLVVGGLGEVSAAWLAGRG